MRSRWCIAGAVLFCGLVIGLAEFAASRFVSHHHHDMPTGSAQDALCRTEKAITGFQQEMEDSMAVMMHDMHAPGYGDDPDADFLAMMIPHHQGAIDMARLVLTYGDDPLTRRLAEDIIASQRAEIAAMQARLAILRKGPDPEPNGFPALSGTRGY